MKNRFLLIFCFIYSSSFLFYLDKSIGDLGIWWIGILLFVWFCRPIKKKCFNLKGRDALSYRRIPSHAYSQLILSFRVKILCCFIGNNHEDQKCDSQPAWSFLRFRSVSFSFNWWRIRHLSVNGGQLTGNVIWKGSSQKFCDFLFCFIKVSFPEKIDTFSQTNLFRCFLIKLRCAKGIWSRWDGRKCTNIDAFYEGTCVDCTFCLCHVFLMSKRNTS